MKTRKIVILSAVGLIVAGVAAFSLFGGEKEPTEEKPQAPAGQPVVSEAVRQFETVVVRNDTVPFELTFTGRVRAAESVEIFAEVQGLVERVPKGFRDGVRFSKGETMVAIDDREFRLSLQAAKSRFQSALVSAMPDLKLDYPDDYPAWNAYLASIDASAPLPDLPETQKEQTRYFLSARGVFEQFYSIKSQEERLGKHVVRAPFEGTVTDGSVDQGALVSPQKRLGAFMRTDAYEVAVAADLADLPYLKTGARVALTSRELPGKSWQGRVARVSKRLDPNTQRVQVYLSVSGADLREGMYLEGRAEGGAVGPAMLLPREAVTRSGQVYEVRDSTARLVPVKPLRYMGGQVAVSGLEDGAVVIAQQVANSIEGAKVAPRR